MVKPEVSSAKKKTEKAYQKLVLHSSFFKINCHFFLSGSLYLIRELN